MNGPPNSISTYIAIYGALLSTAVALWNAYQRWRSGPKLVGHIAPNMVGYGSWAQLSGTYLALSISNRGNASTTITHVFSERYDNFLDRFLKRRPRVTIAKSFLPDYTIPFTIGPGGEFRNLMLQSAEVEKWSRDSWFYMCIKHSMADRPCRIHVKPIGSEEASP
jgi:hypothetical protein